MSKILDLLLRPETPNVQKDLRRQEYEILRLSKVYGEPFVITLKGLPYGRAVELREMADYEIHTVLAGDGDGVFKNPALLERHEAATPAELVKMLLEPGEIRAISVAVEQLSGFRSEVLRPVHPADAAAEAIEKNSETARTTS